MRDSAHYRAWLAGLPALQGDDDTALQKAQRGECALCREASERPA